MKRKENKTDKRRDEVREGENCSRIEKCWERSSHAEKERLFQPNLIQMKMNGVTLPFALFSHTHGRKRRVKEGKGDEVKEEKTKRKKN